MPVSSRAVPLDRAEIHILNELGAEVRTVTTDPSTSTPLYDLLGIGVGGDGPLVLIDDFQISLSPVRACDYIVITPSDLPPPR